MTFFVVLLNGAPTEDQKLNKIRSEKGIIKLRVK